MMQLTLAALTALLEFVIDAHGGLERFQRADEITIQMDGRGAVVRSKRWGRVPGHIEISCATSEQRSTITPFPKTGQRGVFTNAGVRIESLADGSVLSSRADPRSRFPGGRRLLWWDDLDMLYFIGYAMWGYVCAPFTLLWPGVEAHETDPWVENGETWRRLDVSYPDGFDVHSRRQQYYFDSNGMLRRNDYTAEVFGGFAKSAHLCFEPREFGGLVFPTRRRVYSRGGNNRPRRFPTLVSIDLLDAQVR
jgi:hypothetical protein